MPFYDYYCKACETWRVDEWFHMISDSPKTLPCTCGGEAEKMPSMGCMMHSTLVPGIGRVFNPDTPMTGAKNIWEGTKLADSDGKNRVHYRSDRIQVDMGG